MIRNLIAAIGVAALVALTGCQSISPQTTSALLGTATLAIPSIQGHGTLAAENSFEWRAAPHYTALAAVRKQANDALAKKQIHSSAREAGLAVEREARANLEQAEVADKAGKPDLATAYLLKAGDAVARAQSILNEAKKAGVK
jgi:hypothetical protein